MKKTILALAAILVALTASNNITLMAQKKITQTAGRNVLGEFAPKFAELNDDVLFGEAVWNDSTLSLHDHSMVTISILLGKGMVDSSFRSHLEMGKKHGITRKEIAALLTQAAFYAVFHRQQLSGPDIQGTDSFQQCNLRAALPQQLAYSSRDQRRGTNAGLRCR